METASEILSRLQTEMRGRTTKDAPTCTQRKLLKRHVSELRSVADFGEKPLQEAKEEAERFLRLMVEDERHPYCLTFCGPSGVGKTMLASIMWRAVAPFGGISWTPIGEGRYVRESKRDCCWLDWRGATTDMKRGQWDAADAAQQAWFTVIDDIGAEHDPTRACTAVLDRVLRSRRGWTVLTCNLPLAEIADKLDARISSWMIRDDNLVTEVNTIDYAMRGL